jgi:hypothetical protein
MIRLTLLALILCPLAVEAAPRLNAIIVPGRSAAFLLIGALFFFGFRWRAR